MYVVGVMHDYGSDIPRTAPFAYMHAQRSPTSLRRPTCPAVAACTTSWKEAAAMGEVFDECVGSTGKLGGPCSCCSIGESA